MRKRVPKRRGGALALYRSGCTGKNKKRIYFTTYHLLFSTSVCPYFHSPCNLLRIDGERRILEIHAKPVFQVHHLSAHQLWVALQRNDGKGARLPSFFLKLQFLVWFSPTSVFSDRDDDIRKIEVYTAPTRDLDGQTQVNHSYR